MHRYTNTGVHTVHVSSFHRDFYSLDIRRQQIFLVESENRITRTVKIKKYKNWAARDFSRWKRTPFFIPHRFAACLFFFFFLPLFHFHFLSSYLLEKFILFSPWNFWEQSSIKSARTIFHFLRSQNPDICNALTNGEEKRKRRVIDGEAFVSQDVSFGLDG